MKPIKEIVRVKVDRPEQQAYLVLAWQAPPLADPDSAALDLAATILGGSESSRLALTLRDTERLVSRVNMNNASQKLSGIVYIQTRLEAGDVDKVEKRILEEIATTRRRTARPRRSASSPSPRPSPTTPPPTRPPTAWPGPTASRWSRPRWTTS